MMDSQVQPGPLAAVVQTFNSVCTWPILLLVLVLVINQNSYFLRTIYHLPTTRASGSTNAKVYITKVERGLQSIAYISNAVGKENKKRVHDADIMSDGTVIMVLILIII